MPGRVAVTRVGLGNLVLTVVLACAGVFLVAGFGTGASEGPAAALIVQLAIWPLLLVRTAPGWAALLVAGGVLATQLLVGPLVTCGVVLPVMCVMAFQLGSRRTSPVQLGLGVIGLVVAAAAEVVLDPALDAGAGVFVGGLVLGFAVGGLVVRSRLRMVERLQRRTEELARQRDRTAELAVAADRARIGADLELAIRARIETISAAARDGRDQLGQPGHVAPTAAALAEVEDQGRETLAAMREVVGVLRTAPTEPAPGIADLTALLHELGTADTRVRVEGTPRSLSPHLELCAYRIVEQLLDVVGCRPRARIEVVVRFTPEALLLRISGPTEGREDAERTATVRAALTAAEARAQVVGGRLETRNPGGRREIDVVLPTLVAR